MGEGEGVENDGLQVGGGEGGGVGEKGQEGPAWGRHSVVGRLAYVGFCNYMKQTDITI